MKLGGSALKLVGLVVLAVLAVGVAVFAITRPVAPPPVSDQVSNYTAPVETAAPVVQVAVIGDSYAVGTGAGDPLQGWVKKLGRNQTWNVTNVARGGTGYTKTVTTDAVKACGLAYCPSYPEMISEAAAANPSLVIVSGGRNDSKVPDEEEAEAIQSFYDRLRASLPAAKIVALNPWWDSTPAPASIGTIAATVKAAVESVGGTYIDTGQPLAAHPELVAADGIHPNPAGHAAIFEATVTKLQDAGIAAR